MNVESVEFTLARVHRNSTCCISIETAASQLEGHARIAGFHPLHNLWWHFGGTLRAQYIDNTLMSKRPWLECDFTLGSPAGIPALWDIKR